MPTILMFMFKDGSKLENIEENSELANSVKSQFIKNNGATFTNGMVIDLLSENLCAKVGHNT